MANVLFYIAVIVLIAGIVFNFVLLKRGRGTGYVYITRKDKEHYFRNYEQAKQFGKGSIRMISQEAAYKKNYRLYKR